jgi:hypothetical protein
MRVERLVVLRVRLTAHLYLGLFSPLAAETTAGAEVRPKSSSSSSLAEATLACVSIRAM